MVSKKKPQSLTYRITDRASCESAIWNAVVLYFIGVVGGAISAAIDILQSGPGSENGAAALLDLLPLAYIGLFAVLALRVHQHKSRVASTLLFAFFVANLLRAFMEHGFAATMGSGIVFAFQAYFGFIFFLGMRGTYLWHSTYRDAPQTIADVLPETGDAAAEHELWKEEQEPIARSPDDLCPKCFEYFEADESTCPYCGTDLRLRASPAHGTII